MTNSISEQILIAIGEDARAAQSAYDYILAQRLGLEGKVLAHHKGERLGTVLA